VFTDFLDIVGGKSGATVKGQYEVTRVCKALMDTVCTVKGAQAPTRVTAGNGAQSTPRPVTILKKCAGRARSAPKIAYFEIF
jgi:hypothetical protein